MADQALWFKLWCASLDDPDLDNLTLADFGRWAKLGALVKQQGNTGELVCRPPARTFCSMFQVPDFDALVACFMCLPHVCVRRETDHVSGETIMNVSFSNWAKYQGDLSTPRVRRFRANETNRGEERRRDKKRRDEKRSPRPPGPSLLRDEVGAEGPGSNPAPPDSEAATAMRDVIQTLTGKIGHAPPRPQ